MALGADLGAPPDAFNPRGQNWGLPPLIPERLRESGYQWFIDTLRANLPPDGMLRLDHVMGLFRLLWIPTGAEATRGLTSDTRPGNSWPSWRWRASDAGP